MKPFRVGLNKDDYYYDLSYATRRGITLQAHISDIHFGVMNPKVEFDILKEQFINKIKGIPLDCISIDGDLFDRLFTSNTDAILYANLFFRELYNICKYNKQLGIHTVLVLLLGTRNHDTEQLRLFYPYLDDPDVDVRIVEQIQFEWINGCKVLCIPELYGVPNEIYTKVLYQSGYYDMVFMHGNIQGVKYSDKQMQSKLFTDKDFAFCTGPVIAGHVHTGESYLGYCYYNGSPIRWCFGEEQPKGFQLILHDMNTKYYYIHKEIITSFRYDTISLDDILMSDPKDIIQYINDLKEKENIHHIRLKYTQNTNSIDTINILKEYYRTNKTVKFSANDKKVDEQIVQRSGLYDKYNYLFNDSMNEYQILAKFINDNEGSVIITADQIIDALKEI